VSDRVDLHALELILTAQCNLRCSYCYQNAKASRRIDWSVVQTALDRLLASRHDDVRILFIGGEPLLEFPTIERAVEYVARHKRREMDVRLAMITNGLLLGEREIAFLAGHGFHVQLSFDGVPSAQALRGEHTFEKLDALLDSLRRDQPAFYENSLKVAITVVPSTIGHLADSVKYFVLDKKIQQLTIGPQITAVDDWRPERISELDEAFSRVFKICLQRYRETAEVPLEVFRKQGRPRRAAVKTRAMCGVGNGDQLAVDVDGQSHGCVTFSESYQTFPTTFLRSRIEAMRLGDIRDAGFDDRLARYPSAVEAAEIFHRKEDKYSSYGRCGDCRYLADCSVCPMSLGRADGDHDPRRVPDFSCAYNLISLKYRARFPRFRSLAERWLARQSPEWSIYAKSDRSIG